MRGAARPSYLPDWERYKHSVQFWATCTWLAARCGRLGPILDGRVTYELMAGFWPTADMAPSSTKLMVECAHIRRDMPKIVYSRTLQRAEWNSTIVRNVVADDVLELKAQPGGDLLFAGADLAATFMRQDLIDEYRLYVHPVVIGPGKPLFPASDTRGSVSNSPRPGAFGSGVVLLKYRRPDSRP